MMEGRKEGKQYPTKLYGFPAKKRWKKCKEGRKEGKKEERKVGKEGKEGNGRKEGRWGR